MKDLFADERADSTIPLALVCVIVAFGIFFIVFSYTFNTPITMLNEMISSGQISTQTQENFELMLDIWKTSPFFVLVGLVLYSLERGKGTDIPVQTLFEYLFLMVIGIIISSYLVYGVGISVDAIINGLDSSTITHVSETWDMTSKRNTLINIIYYALMLPAIITSFLFMVFPIMKQKESSFMSLSGSDETIGDLELQQY